MRRMIMLTTAAILMTIAGGAYADEIEVKILNRGAEGVMVSKNNASIEDAVMSARNYDGPALYLAAFSWAVAFLGFALRYGPTLVGFDKILAQRPVAA